MCGLFLFLWLFRLGTVRDLVFAGLLHVAEEALDVVLLQRVTAVLLLNEPDHSLAAVRIEVVAIGHLPQFEDMSALNIRLLRADLLLHDADILLNRLGLVCKVGNEAQTIIKINDQRLFVQNVPLAGISEHLLAFEVTVLPVPRALDCLNLLVFKHLDLPDHLVLQGKLVRLCNDLHLVRYLMCAYLIRVEQVNFLRAVRINVEVPGAADVAIAIRATHGLVSCDCRQEQQDE